jgi:hypothetical protein
MVINNNEFLFSKKDYIFFYKNYIYIKLFIFFTFKKLNYALNSIVQIKNNKLFYKDLNAKHLYHLVTPSP